MSAPNPNAGNARTGRAYARTQEATIARVGGSMTRGVILLTLDNGAQLRAVNPTATTWWIGARVLYDVDDAGNRYHPRLKDAAATVKPAGMPCDLCSGSTDSATCMVTCDSYSNGGTPARGSYRAYLCDTHADQIVAWFTANSHRDVKRHALRTGGQ